MPTLHLTEDDVRQVLTMEMAIEGVEAGLRKMALEEAVSMPHTRCQTDHVMLHVLPAAAKTLGVVGFKAYTATKKGTLFHITIYDGKTGEMLALLQADYLGQMRTGPPVAWPRSTSLERTRFRWDCSEPASRRGLNCGPFARCET